MKVKLIEIRDRVTFIPVLAIRPGTEYLFRRVAYLDHHVILLRLVDLRSEYDPNKWGDRTMTTAHQYIVDNFERLECGAVVDVEFVLGEVTEPVKSERCFQN